MAILMMKINNHIEIVRSTSPGLSSMSRSSCDALLAVLSRHYAKVGVTIVNNLSDLEGLVDARPDLVFLGMKFVPASPEMGLRDPERIWITTYLDEHEIAYTGSGQRAHMLELNKQLAKQRMLDAGLKTPPFYVVKRQQPRIGETSPLGFPLFIKPTDRGGGLGIDSDSVVRNYSQLRSKLRAITVKLNSDALVEEYLPGREFSVAILKNEASDDFSVMPLELIAPVINGARLLSESVKSSNTEQAIKVADEATKSEVETLAMDVFRALGAQDYGRIDIRLDRFGTPHFLEANLLPSLISGYGSFPKACVANLGLDYEAMILHIVRLGLKRTSKLAEYAMALNIAGTALPSFETAFEPA